MCAVCVLVSMSDSLLSVRPLCVCVLQGSPGEPGKRGKMGRPVKFCLNILYR